MNIHANASFKPWPAPESTPKPDETRGGHGEHDVKRWHRLTAQVRDISERNGFSQTDAARRIGMPSGTFSQWYHGKYQGRLDEQNRKAGMWVDAMEEAGALTASVVPSPGYIATRTAREFENTLALAHQLRKMVIITASGGMGKTTAFERYAATRPHVHLVTASPYTSTVHAILNEVAAVLGVKENDASKRARAIGEYLSRTGAPTLLIMDEAQNLSDQAINQLRHFVDIYNIGLAFGGNTEIYGRFANKKDGPSYAQIKRRVTKRIRRERPYLEDITALLDGWNVTDAETRQYLTGIANKDGALGAMTETLQLAHLFAAGEEKPLDLRHVQAAWKDRDLEGY